MRTVLLALATAAAVAATAVPASAHVYYRYCHTTGGVRYVCGVCVVEAGIDTCRR